MLVKQYETNNPGVEIQYRRAVKPQGNIKAREIMSNVFEPRDEWWRGLGELAKSGLGLRHDYVAFDAERMIIVDVEPTKEEKGCICGEILKGLKQPDDCGLFASACTPSNPVGACMVSSEGACAAHYFYQIKN